VRTGPRGGLGSIGLLLSLACGLGRPEIAPNLVLISLDTTRRDHLSVYGYERDTTPHLARFAAGGVRFEQAYAPTSTTAPTHATLFTSLYPITHRVLKNGQVLIAAHRTLAERLNEQGYATAGFVSSFVLDARFGASQGFDHWDDEFQRETASVVDGQWEGAPFEVFDRRADATTERALAWLDELRGEGSPFFLFVHYFDPHQPYRPPAEFEVRFGSKEGAPNDLRSLVARYDAELAFTDHAVDRLLDAISTVERAANTLVVITADHGEGLMQHGHLGHGVHLYEEQVRVPLLLHWPGHLPAGRVIKGPVSLIDLAPTVLELMGVEVEEGTMQGHSLTGVLEGRSELDRERPIFLLRRHHEPGFEEGIRVAGVQYGLRRGAWKLILAPDEGPRQLYQLAHDPLERVNLAADEPERADALEREIEAWRARYERNETAPSAISEPDRERLRALGYVE
jgi:arylsulfatase A-like enzyme